MSVICPDSIFFEWFLSIPGNDQLDISHQLGTTIINRNISFIQDSNDFIDEFSIEILVSYYKASDIVLGKVILKIPAIGWIFLIPFCCLFL